MLFSAFTFTISFQYISPSNLTVSNHSAGYCYDCQLVTLKFCPIFCWCAFGAKETRVPWLTFWLKRPLFFWTNIFDKVLAQSCLIGFCCNGDFRSDSSPKVHSYQGPCERLQWGVHRRWRLCMASPWRLHLLFGAGDGKTHRQVGVNRYDPL